MYLDCYYDEKKLIAIAIIPLKSITIIFIKTARIYQQCDYYVRKSITNAVIITAKKFIATAVVALQNISTSAMAIVQNVSSMKMLCK